MVMGVPGGMSVAARTKITPLAESSKCVEFGIQSWAIMAAEGKTPRKEKSCPSSNAFTSNIPQTCVTHCRKLLTKYVSCILWPVWKILMILPYVSLLPKIALPVRTSLVMVSPLSFHFLPIGATFDERYYDFLMSSEAATSSCPSVSIGDHGEPKWLHNRNCSFP